MGTVICHRITYRKGNKMSDLAWAVKNGDLDQVKEMVDNKGVDINQQIDGRLPLHYASDYGHLGGAHQLCAVFAREGCFQVWDCSWWIFLRRSCREGGDQGSLEINISSSQIESK